MRLLRSERVDSDVLARAFGISLVVYHHVVLYNGGDVQHALFGANIVGGMGLLMMLSGYSFARFGLHGRSREQILESIVSTAKSIVLPCYLAGLFFMIVARRFSAYELLYIGNFFPGNWQAGFNTWYPQVLLQIFVFLFLLYAIRPLGGWMARRPASGSVALLLAALAMLIVARTIPLPFVSDAKEPWLYLWNFALGWMLFFLNRKESGLPGGRIVATFLCFGAVIAALDLDATRAWTTFGGAALLIWLPSLRLPRLVGRIAMILSQAALWIFILHMSAIKIYGFAIGKPIHAYAVEFIALMVGLVGMWLVVTSASRARRYLKLQASQGRPALA